MRGYSVTSTFDVYVLCTFDFCFKTSMLIRFSIRTFGRLSILCVFLHSIFGFEGRYHVDTHTQCNAIFTAVKVTIVLIKYV